MHKKSVFRSVTSVGSVSLALLALTSVTPAQAGFQWVPPESVESAPVMAPAPAPVMTPDYGAPQIIEGVPAKVQPLTVVPPARTAEPPLPMEAMMDVPVKAPAPEKKAEKMPEPEHFLRLPAGMTDVPAPLAEPKKPASAPEVQDLLPIAPTKAAAPAAESAEKPLRGFAKNVPLAVALRQILPQDYGFSVDQNVSLGTQVSWQGGAPWRDVLKNMLAPAGLTMKEKDQLVEVVPVSASVGEAIMASAPEPMGKSAGMDKLAPAFDAAATKADGKPAYLLAPEAPAPEKKAEKAEPRVIGEAPGQKSMGYLAAPAGMEPMVSVPSSVAPVSLLGGETVVDSWMATKGDTLHEVLKGWAKRANVELSWQAEYDFPLQASIAFGGTFEEAVRGLLSGFENATPQPVGTLHKNQIAGQTVLIIQTRGNKYTD